MRQTLGWERPCCEYCVLVSYWNGELHLHPGSPRSCPRNCPSRLHNVGARRGRGGLPFCSSERWAPGSLHPGRCTVHCRSAPCSRWTEVGAQLTPEWFLPPHGRCVTSPGRSRLSEGQAGICREKLARGWPQGRGPSTPLSLGRQRQQGGWHRGWPPRSGDGRPGLVAVPRACGAEPGRAGSPAGSGVSPHIRLRRGGAVSRWPGRGASAGSPGPRLSRHPEGTGRRCSGQGSPVCLLCLSPRWLCRGCASPAHGSPETPSHGGETGAQTGGRVGLKPRSLSAAVRRAPAPCATSHAGAREKMRAGWPMPGVGLLAL